MCVSRWCSPLASLTTFARSTRPSRRLSGADVVVTGKGFSKYRYAVKAFFNRVAKFKLSTQFCRIKHALGPPRDTLC